MDRTFDVDFMGAGYRPGRDSGELGWGGHFVPPSYAGANRIRFRGLQGGPESPAIPQSQRHLRAAPRETIPVRIGQRGRPGKGLSSLPETRKQPRLGHCERILDSDPAISGETVRMRQRDLIAWPVSVAAAWLAAVMLHSSPEE